MHGIIRPHASEQTVQDSWINTAKRWGGRNRWFLIIVGLPTLLTAIYYYVIATDQYQSEAHFIVRTGDSSPVSMGGFGQFLGLSSGVTQARSDALSVNDFLKSQQAVMRLDQSIGLVGRFRRPEADPFTRLWFSEPTPEALLKYYRDQVDVHMDQETGITSLRVRSYRPSDSYAIINQLLRLGEQRVNILNERSQNDTLAIARRRMTDAEQRLAEIQVAMTRFRQQRGDLDPEGSGKAQIGLAATLQGSLMNARAQLNSMRGIISPSSPQYIATAARVRALEAQAAVQSGAMTNGGGAIAARLGGYQELQVRQEFAAKRYEAAAAMLEKAQNDATRQQLYIVRVVDPNMPVKSEYPQRGKILLTVFLSLIVAYGIGWLLAAGVREHSL